MRPDIACNAVQVTADGGERIESRYQVDDALRHWLLPRQAAGDLFGPALVGEQHGWEQHGGQRLDVRGVFFRRSINRARKRGRTSTRSSRVAALVLKASPTPSMRASNSMSIAIPVHFAELQYDRTFAPRSLSSCWPAEGGRFGAGAAPCAPRGRALVFAVDLRRLRFGASPARSRASRCWSTPKSGSEFERSRRRIGGERLEIDAGGSSPPFPSSGHESFPRPSARRDRPH